MEIIPKQGFKGLIENWQSDLVAAFSVSMVALPLGLGIAIASGVPPMAGILAAVIGGVVTTLYRGSHIGINGPTAGLIAVFLASIEGLNDGSGKTLSYVFAAVVVSGALQVIMGFLKFGQFADIFHSTVIHGILAAIGVIIFIKQIHVALGTTSETTHVLETLVDVLHQIPNINPFVLIISITGLLLLIFHSRLSYKVFHFMPAPMWVLLISIPFVYAFNFFEPHTINFLGRHYKVGPELLINIPDNILDAISFPDFSKINTLPFWTSVFSITLIASIELLASGKAIDKMDPYRRKTDLNKDLVGIGISTMVSGALGGLPVISVIVRSTVNVQNNAKTKWSNFFHGILLLIFIFLLAHIIQKVPLAALATLLVFTGYKMASPKVFRHIYSQGVEQLIFFTGTLIFTLATNLLFGVFAGLLLTLFVHFLLAKVPVPIFFKMIFKSGTQLVKTDEKNYTLQIRGIANFLSTLQLDKLLLRIPPNSTVNIDFSKARLVDFSILENIYEYQRIHANTGGKVHLKGLEKHSSSSYHKLALKVSALPLAKLNTHQLRLKTLAGLNDWNFKADPSVYFSYLQSFHFFKTRPVEKRLNTVWSKDENQRWEIVDVKFEEGAFALAEEFKTTLGLIKFPFAIPKFTIEKIVFPQRYLPIWKHKDIDYDLYSRFSRKFIVKVEDKKEMDAFLIRRLRRLIESNEIIEHLESNGETILLFTDNRHLAHMKDYPKIADFAERMQSLIEQPHVQNF